MHQHQITARCNSPKLVKTGSKEAITGKRLDNYFYLGHLQTNHGNGYCMVGYEKLAASSAVKLPLSGGKTLKMLGIVGSTGPGRAATS